jgi:hypothetical protein
LAWIWIVPAFARPSRSAWSIISSQVRGGFGTRSLRYQSNCVLVLNGAA